MNLIWQIFRKDLERLWWMVAGTLIPLALFTWADLKPESYAQGVGASVNLALPLAWCLIAALAIAQDPLTGDKQFWVTLPCGWWPLLTAKALFLAAFVHLPYFIATFAILLARGFNPLDHLPLLLWKQLLLLALMMASVAIAATVESFAQFLLVAISAVAALVLLTPNTYFYRNVPRDWDVRWNVAVAVLSIGSLIVLAIQFATRFTRVSRIIGVGFAAISVSLYLWMPLVTAATVFADFSPAPSMVPVLSLVPEGAVSGLASRTLYNFRRTTLAIPYRLLGLPENLAARPELVSLSFRHADGEAFPATVRNEQSSLRIVATLNWINDRAGSGLIEVNFYNPNAWKAVRRERVAIAGRMIIDIGQPDENIPLPAQLPAHIPGFGRCQAPADESAPFIAAQYRYMFCESPEPSSSRSQNLAWRRSFSDSFLFLPQDSWLSPLYRSVLLLGGPGGTQDYPLRRRRPLGSRIVKFSLPDVDLNGFVVNRPNDAKATQ